MQQQEIHDFLITYFQSNACEVLENTSSYLTVQLTIEMDKELMNRPFYWHYLEKTGGIPNPGMLTFITHPELAPPDLKGEIIHFGSPRLHQIIQSTKRLAGFIRLFEDRPPLKTGQSPLFPWLTQNVKISYQCDRKKDIFMSIGLNLISGEFIEGFNERLLSVKVTPKIPDYSFTLSPLIMPKSGLSRLDTYIRKSFENDDHTWAEEAMERWQTDLNLLEHFYKDMEEKSESYFTEKQALQAQYEPNIQITIINGGLFYLSDQSLA
ncbi:YqhG family protein [Peribacillus sp. NPDC097197]|uniref:YqhG family protein n=1 Tax=unclassified Peribacillus TaxID=2675266 RepID=UPI0038019B83